MTAEPYRARASRRTSDTWPVPPPLLPSSGPNPRVWLNPRLDVWIRTHPPKGPEMAILALLVAVLILAACL